MAKGEEEEEVRLMCLSCFALAMRQCSAWGGRRTTQACQVDGTGAGACGKESLVVRAELVLAKILQRVVWFSVSFPVFGLAVARLSLSVATAEDNGVSLETSSLVAFTSSWCDDPALGLLDPHCN